LAPEGFLPSAEIGSDLSSSFVGAVGKPIKMKRISKGSKTYESAVAGAGTVLGIATATGKWVDWWFVPYVHPVQMSVHRQLCREARRTVAFQSAAQVSQAAYACPENKNLVSKK
jgi:hypothetical protein